jgi:uncharacterized delta-60 repeat protein
VTITHAAVFDLALLADGSIVAAAATGLYRYDTNGSLDPTFGTPAGLTSTYAVGVLAEPAGTFLVTTLSNAVQRHDSTGAYTGLSAPLGSQPRVADVTLQPDGRVLVNAGNGISSSTVRRFEAADLTVDGTFTNSVVPVGPLRVHPDGHILAGGWDAGFGKAVTRLDRLNGDGSVDSGFGSAGSALADMTRSGDRWQALAAQSDGRVVAAGMGTSTEITGSPEDVFTVARFFAGTCGDSAVDPGEECDDGNVASGDGCDQNCCLADADGDGICDSLDPCNGAGLVATKPKAHVTRVGGDLPGALTIGGTLTLPQPLVPAFDPAARGVRVVIDDADQRHLDLTIPPGTRAPGQTTGWTTKVAASRTTWTWTDKTKLAAGGINKVVVIDRSAVTPGVMQFTIRGSASLYPMTAPVSAIFALDGTTSGGQCAAVTFPGPLAPVCTTDTTRDTITCK